MSGGHVKRSEGLKYDDVLIKYLKPAYFSLVGFLHKMALLAIFLGLVGYTLYQLEKENINILDMIFQTESIRLPVDR